MQSDSTNIIKNTCKPGYKHIYKHAYQHLPKQTRMAIACALLLFICTGCSVIPQEAEIREDLVSSTKVQKDDSYTVAQVKQGDLKIRSRLICKTQSVDETELSFGVSGLEYGQFYVSVGDHVKSGDVLAELDMSGVEETIEETEREYKIKQLEAQHYNTMIADAKAIGKLDGTADSDLNEQLSELQESKNDAVAAYNLAKERYEEALQDQKNRQIVAPSDGTVTYVYDTSTKKNASGEDASTSNREITVFKLSSDNYVYTTQTTEYRNYPLGTEVEMTISGQSYTLKVIKDEALDTEDDEETKHELTLKLLDSTVTINPDAVARSKESVKTLTDVVYVTQDAIVTLDGKNYAYVVDEDGMRSAVLVETGLSDGENIEVVSGLTPGQQVILK